MGLERRTGKEECARMELTHVRHIFGPVYDENSRILILGTFPSVKSREQQFYYAHPKNRFWKILAALAGEAEPETREEKRSFLLTHRIALWDVIQFCDIAGSADTSIRNVVPNDMDVIFQKAAIRRIFANGNKAFQLYLRYCKKEGQPPLVRLPSTSPANAAWSMEMLLSAWGDAFREIPKEDLP